MKSRRSSKSYLAILEVIPRPGARLRPRRIILQLLGLADGEGTAYWAADNCTGLKLSNHILTV